MFVLNVKDDTPVYVQLQNQILEYIALGILKKDDQLPSVRSLSKELGINPNTVAKAYANLEIMGCVYSVPSKGVFILEEKVQEDVVLKKLEELSMKIKDCRNMMISQEKVHQLVSQIYEEEKKDA